MSSPIDQAYQTMLEQHRALKDLLGRIDTALRERSATMEQVGRMLGELGDKLVKHFALEESGGYFGEALLHAPRLVSRANDLMAQHPKMAVEAKSIVPLGASAEDWWAETAKRFEAFTKELLLHEQREDRLLQEAYTNDIEAGD